MRTIRLVISFESNKSCIRDICNTVHNYHHFLQVHKVFIIWMIFHFKIRFPWTNIGKKLFLWPNMNKNCWITDYLYNTVPVTENFSSVLITDYFLKIPITEYLYTYHRTLAVFSDYCTYITDYLYTCHWKFVYLYLCICHWIFIYLSLSSL